MANHILLFVLLLSATVIIARECSVEESLRNCDDCIRCGGKWCHSAKGNHCTTSSADSACPDPVKNVAVTMNNINVPIVSISRLARKEIQFTCPEVIMPNIILVNSTQTYNISKSISEKVRRVGDQCRFVLDMRPRHDFCASDGTTAEFFDVDIAFDSTVAVADIKLKYHVPCACNCSQYAERDSRQCNGHGDFSCGVCICKQGWSGDRCEKEAGRDSRGDIPQCNSDKDCNGNGECRSDFCQCYQYLEGSKYFDETCKDICSYTREHDVCLENPDESTLCNVDPYPIYYRPYNDTLLNETDNSGASVWVRCNKTFGDCLVQYAAMIDDQKGQHTVSIIKSCKAVAAPVDVDQSGVTIALPVVLGIVALVAAAVAVAGYVFWKNRAQPPPLSESMYQHIDPDSSQVENPLYKSPKIMYSNPTYGK